MSANIRVMASRRSSHINLHRQGMFYLAASIAIVCMDVIILLVPLRIIVPLQVSKRQKASLSFLFATGGFVIFIAIYNSFLTAQLFNSNNYTGGLAYELSWMYGELDGCVVCSSASSLKPFFVRYLPSIISTPFGNSKGGATGASHQLSRGPRVSSRLPQISRRQPDSYELDSQDDLDSAKKGCCGDADETQLWPGMVGQGDQICTPE